MVGGKASYQMEKLDYFPRAIVRYVVCMSWYYDEVVTHNITLMSIQNYKSPMLPL